MHAKSAAMPIGEPRQVRWRQEKIYSYSRPRDGREIFQRVKSRDRSELTNKKVEYRHQCDPRSRCVECLAGGWHWCKPAGANGYLYRLPEVVRALVDQEDIWWAEGEGDADALARAGVVATSHHQGAVVGPTRLQARWLAGIDGVARVVLVYDRDPDGVVDVVRRYDLLLSVRVPATRLVVVRGRVRKLHSDAADHLAAGYGIKNFEPRSIELLRPVAARYDTVKKTKRHRSGWYARRIWNEA